MWLGFRLKECLQSFHEGAIWPVDLASQPIELARAGLYWVGPGDRVSCVFCGGSLRNWSRRAIALVEHAKHFNGCCYIKILKSRNLFPTESTPRVEDSTSSSSIQSDNCKFFFPLACFQNSGRYWIMEWHYAHCRHLWQRFAIYLSCYLS